MKPATSRPFGFAHCINLGRLAQEPEVKFSPNGKPISKIALAINESLGQPHSLDITLFGACAVTLVKYGGKGRGLVVHGRIATHTWETSEGAHRKMVDLVADEFHFADRARRRTPAPTTPRRSPSRVSPALPGWARHPGDRGPVTRIGAGS